MKAGSKQKATAVIEASVVTVEGSRIIERSDAVAAEEPMEVRVVVDDNGQPVHHSIAVTMRTPGNDFELTVGFLWTEGILNDRNDILQIGYCQDTSPENERNIVNFFLRPGAPFDPSKFSRNVYTTSSCGVCGKASLEMVRIARPAQPVGDFKLADDYFLRLPQKLREEQALFSQTGGLHASALFDSSGQLLILREDVGRHNAMDKLVGWLCLQDRLPASNTVVLVSGRSSFELVQKAQMAGIPVLAAIGAPSSLSIDLAREFDMSLVGFLRDGRFNLYAGAGRIHSETQSHIG